MNTIMHNKSSISGKEQGVVLLTCLIFMLILLAMLRFTLTSAKVEEQKAAIDVDMVTAREAAQSALNFAEDYILRQGELYCQVNLGNPSATCQDNPAQFAGTLFGLADADLANVTNGTPTISSIFNNGLYTGAMMNIPAAVGCRPFWGCVNWPIDAHAVRNSAVQMGLSANPSFSAIECTECANALGSHVSRNPYFIIERLTAGDFVNTAPNFASASPQAVILRVTAVGFGKGAAGSGNTANSNLGNVMLQSTYILGK